MSPQFSARKAALLPAFLLAATQILPIVTAQNNLHCSSFTCFGSPNSSSSSVGQGTTTCTYSNSQPCVYDSTTGAKQSGELSCPSTLACQNCQAGFGYDQGKCDQCTAGQYSPASSANACQQCATGLQPNSDASDCVAEQPPNCQSYANGCANLDRNGQSYDTGVLHSDGSVDCSYKSTQAQQNLSGEPTHNCSYDTNGELITGGQFDSSCWTQTPQVCGSCEGGFGYSDGTCTACGGQTISPAGSSSSCAPCQNGMHANSAHTQCLLSASHAAGSRRRSRARANMFGSAPPSF